MDELPLSGRVALITGAASGIGEASARVIADAGASVAALDRDAAGLARVVSELENAGAKALAVTLDLSDTASIPAAVAEVLAAYGRIDILVNCAGTPGSEQTSILEQSEENWDRVHTINLKAPFLLMQHVGRHMVERGGGGRIVNVSSSSAFRAQRSIPPYGSSKAALVQLTRSAAADLGPYDINVNAVAPGLTATAMTTGIGDNEAMQQMVSEGPLANLFQRVSQPEDVAATILFLCLPASRQITAQTIHTSAGAVV
jgi:NAD(P)-dependent dehydrogenase (short-subunit alcohol dehydrogenase family)